MIRVIVPVYWSVLEFLVMLGCSKAPPTPSSTKGARKWPDLPFFFPIVAKKQQYPHQGSIDINACLLNRNVYRN